MYEKGKDLNGIHLKVFSSESLELFLKKVIEYCFTLMGIENGKICQDYLSDSENILDDQKFDQHIYINNKIVLMHENHACVDKSFYTQKRGVIQDIMKLPFCTEKLHTNVKFVILSYASEVTNKTKITQDKTKGSIEKHDIIVWSALPHTTTSCVHLYFTSNRNGNLMIICKCP